MDWFDPTLGDLPSVAAAFGMATVVGLGLNVVFDTVLSTELLNGFARSRWNLSVFVFLIVMTPLIVAAAVTVTARHAARYLVSSGHGAGEVQGAAAVLVAPA